MLENQAVRLHGEVVCRWVRYPGPGIGTAPEVARASGVRGASRFRMLSHTAS